MIRRTSFGHACAWILLVCCFLPVTARVEAQAIPGSDSSPAGAVPRLTSLKATPAGDEVRVFLGLDADVEARPFLLYSPDRLVVDLHGAETGLDRARYDLNSPLVSRVRVGQRTEKGAPVARVVLDLKQASPYSVEAAPGGLLVTVGSADPATGRQTATETSADRFAASRAGSGSSETSSARAGSARGEHAGSAIPRPAASSRMGSAAAGSAPLEGPSQGEAGAAARPSAIGSSTDWPPLAAEAAPPVQMARMAPLGATPAEASSGQQPAGFEMRTIGPETKAYTGKKISLNLVDADIKQVFRLFHEISGLNFVLDPGVSGNLTIVLDEVPWDQALDIILRNNGLDKVYEENVVRIATTQKLAAEAGGRKALREAKELEAEPVTITRRLSYAKAKELDQVIRTGVLLSQRGKSFYDERTNMLIVTDVPTKVAPLEKLISDLDAVTPQVMIEARIVLTGRDFLQDLGIDWGFSYARTQTSNNFPHHGDVSYDLNLPRAAGSSRLGFNLFNRSESFSLNVALDALEADGRTRTLSAPKIATQDNVKAEIEQGVQIPIANSTATEINVQFVSASLRLSVTPQITAEGTVIMEITVENNSPSATLQVQTIPAIDTQRAQTKVMVEDGGTTVIGGIFQVKDSESETGVPFLRKIPVLGWLFKSRNITTQNRELLIFITPKILKAT